MGVTSTIIWSAIPNGFTENGKYKLSVLVSPRLEFDSFTPAPHTLSLFPLFLSWPEHLNRFRFSAFFYKTDDTLIEIRDKTQIVTSPKPDNNLWKELFSGTTEVESFKFDDYKTDTRIKNPVNESELQRSIKRIYVGRARSSPTELDIVRNDPFLKTMKKLVFTSEDMMKYSRIATVLDSDHAVDDKEYDNETLNFYRIEQYLQQSKKIDSMSTDQKIDFHRTISLLGNYPNLMRRLGLIIDLIIEPISSIPPSDLPTKLKIRIRPIQMDNAAINVFLYPLKTIFHRDVFRPYIDYTITSKSLHQKGLLTLNDNNLFEIIPIDVINEYAKISSSIRTLSKHLDNLEKDNVYRISTAKLPFNTSSGLSNFTLSPIRSSGLSLVKKQWSSGTGSQDGRRHEIMRGIDKSVEFNTALRPPRQPDESDNRVIELYMNNLIRGYRIDIYAKSNNDDNSYKWFSLCERKGEYRFKSERSDTTPENLGIPSIDEGYVGFVVEEGKDVNNDEIRVVEILESLCRWSGWSLCVSRPGTHLDENGTPERFKQTPENGLPIIATFTVPKGSLPRLRFGHKYKMRARVVDLAGNGPTLKDVDDRFASTLEEYLRFESVPPPEIVLRKSLDGSPGESLEHLVIRSFNDSIEKDDVPPQETQVTERHIVPPACSQSLAEAHGMFDHEKSGQMQRLAYRTIIEKEGVFNESGIHPELQMILPYLPDPLSRGAAFLGIPSISGQYRILREEFLGLPGAILHREVEFNGDEEANILELNLTDINHPASEIRIDGSTLVNVRFGNKTDWPDFKPFLFKMKGILASNPPVLPAWDSTKRTLTISVPQATIAHTRLSSYIEKESLSLMGIWKWMQESGSFNNQELQELKEESQRGLLWMLTPHRKIILVHALQQPLGRPKITHLQSNRLPGTNFVTLNGNVLIHCKSTGKIDLIAKWQDCIDDPEVGESQLPWKTHVFEQKIEYPSSDNHPSSPDNVILDNIRHEFGDTKHREVKYHIVSTSRFQEYFNGMVTNTDGTESKFVRVSEEKTINILSSVRPEAPKVLYIIPTFRWKRNGTLSGNLGDRIKSIRFGGGVRVYLEGPWFSSGCGEKLGVILPEYQRSPPIPSPPDTLKPYITQWGADPIRDYNGEKYHSPFQRQFRNQDSYETGLILSEIGIAFDGWKFAVVGHKVSYDKGRRQWYCDIEIQGTQSYYPFIRFALARYQPDSVTEGGDVKLSSVVLTDFVQLAPNRSVDIFLDPAYQDPKRLRVTIATDITSPTNSKESLPIGIPSGSTEIDLIDLSVEKRVPTINSDLGWRTLRDGVQITRNTNTSDQRILWDGTVILPEPSVNKSLRLVVKEYELYNFIIDSSIPSDGDDFVQIGSKKYKKRLVYADMIEL